MPYTLSQGNVDTEAGGQGQIYSSPSGGNTLSGNFDTEAFAQQPSAPTFDFSSLLGQLGVQQPQTMQGYEQLGGAINQLTAMMQQMQAQQAQMQMQQPMTGPQQGSMSLPTGSLTQGFNQNWLGQSVNTASANGAAIGGIGKNPGTGPSGMTDSGYGGQGFGGPTVRNNDPSTLKGADRLMDGGGGGGGSWFKSLFSGGGR